MDCISLPLVLVTVSCTEVQIPITGFVPWIPGLRPCMLPEMDQIEIEVR